MNTTLIRTVIDVVLAGCSWFIFFEKPFHYRDNTLNIIMFFIAFSLSVLAVNGGLKYYSIRIYTPKPEKAKDKRIGINRDKIVYGILFTLMIIVVFVSVAVYKLNESKSENFKQTKTMELPQQKSSDRIFDIRPMTFPSRKERDE
jgi:hypothetical protein